WTKRNTIGMVKEATMVPRVLSTLVVALALTVTSWGCRSTSTATTHQGRVVDVGTATLTMTDTAGANQHTHTVPSNAVITCDGEPCGLNDLKAGDLVTVTMETQEGKTFATKIEASKFLAVS